MSLRILALPIGLLLVAPAAGADGEDWNQRRGDAAGTATSTLEPIRAEPTEEWRQDLDQVFGEPVAWGGIVYVVGMRGRERRLFAFRSAGGEKLGSVSLGKPAPTEIAVWQGTVVVVDPEGVRTFDHRKDRFRLRKRLPGKWQEPCVFEGQLFLTNGSSTACFDIDRGKELFRVTSGVGRPAVRDDGDGGATLATITIGSAPGYDGTYLMLNTTLLTRSSTGFQAGRTETSVLGLVHDGEFQAQPGYVAVLRDEDTLERNWFLRSTRPLQAGGGGAFHSCTVPEVGGGIRLAQIVTDAAIHAGHVLGFSPQGTLIRVRSDGAFHEVVEEADLPSGARPGPASVAGDVLYVGNWAVETESQRVLWCLEEAEPEGALIPVSDQRAVYVSPAGELVGLVDPRRLELEQLPASLVAGGKPLRPDDGNAVILDDGRVLLEPQPGDYDPARVAFVEDAQGPRLLGEEFPVFQAWRNVIYAQFYGELEELVEMYSRDRHIGDCQRLLEEAEEFGMPPEDLRRLEDALTGKAENRSSNADAKRARKRREEGEVRARTMEFVLAAAGWCQKRGLDHAATVLLSRGRKIVEGRATPEILAAAAELVPESFPWRDEDDAALRWLTWADEMLPAGAHFLASSDPLWERAGEDWRRRGIGLRTANLVVLSLELDPAVLGPALRKGEGTLRALTELLPPSADAGTEPLEVRILEDHESYLGEMAAHGVELSWSAGFYSPAERISRFFVPRDTESEPLDRELSYVLAHELTHHYVDQRWIPGAGQSGHVEQPGYWVVEGFARFVEDQILELGRGDRGFEDATVKSLDATAQMAQLDGLFPLRQLIDASYVQFYALSGEPDVEVQLRYTLRRVGISARNLFYEQSGSLVFFLMNRRAAAGRELLIEYLRRYYLGGTKPEGWTTLGYAEVEAFERDFRSFLDTLAD